MPKSVIDNGPPEWPEPASASIVMMSLRIVRAMSFSPSIPSMRVPRRSIPVTGSTAAVMLSVVLKFTASIFVPWWPARPRVPVLLALEPLT